MFFKYQKRTKECFYWTYCRTDSTHGVSNYLFPFSEWTEAESVSTYSHFRTPSLPVQRRQALSTVNQTIYHTKANSVNYDHSRNSSFDIDRTNKFVSARPSYEDLDYAEVSSNRHLMTDSHHLMSEQASTSSAPQREFSSESQVLYHSKEYTHTHTDYSVRAT